MNPKRSVLIWALPLVVAGVIGGVMSLGWMKGEFRKANLAEDCKQIRLGMTREQVVEIMGAPLTTASFQRDGKEKIMLIFPSKTLASTPPQCVIDQSTQKVEEVICDEDYRLKSEK